MGSRRRDVQWGDERRGLEFEGCDDKWWRPVASSNDDDDGDGRHDARFSRRPVPSSDGRSRALHRELLGGRNTARKLMCREIGQLRGRMPPRPDELFCTEKFRRFKLQEQFCVRNGMESAWTTISITGITRANDFIFVVASSGVCTAFRESKNGSIATYRRDDGQIWSLNKLDERIQLVFYNKINDSIIIVSATGRFIVRCETRALPLESIRSGNHWDNGVQIFGVSSIGTPVFYDDNNLALVQSSTSVHNVHEMNNYNIVHSFRRKKLLYAKSRPGILIVAYMLTKAYLPIEILSTDHWVVLKRINYAVPPSGFGFFCICQDNILLKEKGEETRMINIWNDDGVNLIKKTNNLQPDIYDLTTNRFLLRFNENIVVASCNSHDEQVTLLEDNEIPGDYNKNRYFDSDIYVTRNKKYAMIYSRKLIEKPSSLRQEFFCVGSINIYNTFSGESVWKINPCDDVDHGLATRMEVGNNVTNIHSTILEALEDVTTLFYDEERHRIYTGNKRGFFHVWSN